MVLSNNHPIYKEILDGCPAHLVSTGSSRPVGFVPWCSNSSTPRGTMRNAPRNSARRCLVRRFGRLGRVVIFRVKRGIFCHMGVVCLNETGFLKCWQMVRVHLNAHTFLKKNNQTHPNRLEEPNEWFAQNLLLSRIITLIRVKLY